MKKQKSLLKTKWFLILILFYIVTHTNNRRGLRFSQNIFTSILGRDIVF